MCILTTLPQPQSRFRCFAANRPAFPTPLPPFLFSSPCQPKAETAKCSLFLAISCFLCVSHFFEICSYLKGTRRSACAILACFLKSFFCFVFYVLLNFKDYLKQQKQPITLSLYQGGLPRVCRGVWPYCSSKTVPIKPSTDFSFSFLVRNGERHFLNVHFTTFSHCRGRTFIFHFV